MQTDGSRPAPRRAPVLVLLLLASFTADHPRRPRRRRLARSTRSARAVGDGARPGRERHRGRRTPVHGGARRSSAPPAACAATWPGWRPRTPSCRAELAGAGVDRNRAAELDGPARHRRSPPATRWSRPGSSRWARPSRSRRTVTIDAGTTLRRAPRHDRAQQRRPRRPGGPRRPLHRHRAAARRPGLRGRRPARLQHGGRLPARPRPGRRRRPASTSTSSTPPRPPPRATRWSPGAAATARRTSPGIPIGRVDRGLQHPAPAVHAGRHRRRTSTSPRSTSSASSSTRTPRATAR